MKELSTKARAMLDALQTVDSPPANAELQVWSAVAARTAAGDLGPALAADTPVAAATGATWGVGKTLAVVIAAAAIATGIGVSTDADVSAPTRLVGAGVPALAPVSPAAAPQSEPDDVVVLAEPVERNESPVNPAAKPARSRPRAEPAKVPPSEPGIEEPDALEREMRLMSDARAALGAGDAGRAITLLLAHAKQFPKGAFVLEREVSWITALCAQGKTDAARKRAQTFLGRHGSHALAAKVRASCGGTP